MILINSEWNEHLAKYEVTYLADTKAEVEKSKIDPNCAMGSVIFVISTGDTYMKNTDNKWQKVGSEEVLA